MHTGGHIKSDQGCKNPTQAGFLLKKNGLFWVIPGYIGFYYWNTLLKNKMDNMKIMCIFSPGKLLPVVYIKNIMVIFS